ncbi:FAD dependent oxidoreductase superfamily protein [Rutstroemia sp. NJR-2017a WRK4]|nr:FAD dependent oxidoreductase superfamily protein [Rutstroemia sp. NJR-2017a WRK4]
MSQNTVILGSGIIGLSTAYYLSQGLQPSTIHLIDPSPALFSSASGYAGGFLARDWFSAACAELGELSFEEHRKLAEEYNGGEKWGWGWSTSFSFVAGQKQSANGKATRGDDWLRGDGSRAVESSGASKHLGPDENGAGSRPRWLRTAGGDTLEVISGDETTAQVDPLRLCKFLLETCISRGVQLHHPAQGISIHQDMRNEISSIRVLDTATQIESDIPCTKILIAAGAWSPSVFSTLFPQSKLELPITSLAGHSLVVRAPDYWNADDEGKGCHAVFASNEDEFSPEIFSRKAGEIYVAGLNSSTIPLPKLATGSKIEDESIRKLEKVTKQMLKVEVDKELDVVRKGLCFRPVTNKGVPILARIPDTDLGGVNTRGAEDGGVWLAAGHGPWGISQSLGTGKVMAEMMQGKPTSADVSRLGL